MQYQAVCAKCGTSFNKGEVKMLFASHFNHCYDYEVDLPDTMCLGCAIEYIEADQVNDDIWKIDEDESINPEDL